MTKKDSKAAQVTAAVLVMVGWAGLAVAQEAERGLNRHSLTGFVGGQLADLTNEFQDAGASFQEQVNFGARYQYNLTPRWGVEGSFLYTPFNAELVEITREVSVDTWYYNGNVVFNIIPHGRLIPYATGGAGVVTLDVEGGDVENRFAGNFGGGLLARVTDRIGVRFHVRDYVYRAEDLDTQSTAALGVPVGFDRTIHDLALDIGVSISF